jgi:hypothetical protein
MRKINLAILTATCVLQSSCMTAADYANTPTAKLCIDYLTLPSINFNHPAREEELRRRGENCAAYTGIAAQRRAADDAFERSLQNMQRSTNNSPAASNPPQGTHQFIKDGKVVTCTTTGNVTQCY